MQIGVLSTAVRKGLPAASVLFCVALLLGCASPRDIVENETVHASTDAAVKTEREAMDEAIDLIADAIAEKQLPISDAANREWGIGRGIHLYAVNDDGRLEALPELVFPVYASQKLVLFAEISLEWPEDGTVRIGGTPSWSKTFVPEFAGVIKTGEPCVFVNESWGRWVFTKAGEMAGASFDRERSGEGLDDRDGRALFEAVKTEVEWADPSEYCRFEAE